MAEEGDREEKLEHFKNVCAVDDVVARQFLERCDWHLEAAVQDYLNFQEGRPNAFGHEGEQNEHNRQNELRRRRPEGQPGPSNLLHPNGQPRSSATVRRVGPAHRQRRPQTWLEWTWTLLLLPFRFTYQSLYDILTFMMTVFYRPALGVTDPEGDVRSFLEEFEDTYGPDHPTFYRGSYSQALNEAKQNFRFLLVYLHNSSHQDTDRYVVDTLLSPEMKHYIESNALLLWGCSVRTPEGQRTSMALRENTYPFLALICLRENRMAIVLRLEGCYEARDLISMLDVAVSDNRPFLDAARLEKEQREVDTRLRREQEAAYQESLRADRQRLSERRRLESERQDEVQRLLDTENAEKAKKERFEKLKQDIAAHLPDEPDPSNSDCVRVSIKFPNGSRHERRFMPDDSLELLFNATLVHPECPDNFSLVSSYPRKTLNCAPRWYSEYGSSVQDPDGIQTFRATGLEKAVMVLVQNNDA